MYILMHKGDFWTHCNWSLNEFEAIQFKTIEAARHRAQKVSTHQKDKTVHIIDIEQAKGNYDGVEPVTSFLNGKELELYPD